MNSEASIAKGKWVSGRYEIIDIIGHGTSGTVVKAIDHVEPSSTVVLKILSSDMAQQPRSAARFEREMRLMGELAHPNIVHVFGCSAPEEKIKYIAMEHIRGESLRDRLNKQDSDGLPFDEVIRILLAMARAIDYAHEKGIVHRDLKPDNVLLCRNDEVKITDFGLAKFMDEEQKVTVSGEVLGSPAYMSPEHIHGEAIDQQSDIYTLGVIAYELVVGAPPFEGESFYAVAGMHLKKEFPRIDRSEHPVPEWFQAFIDKCSRKEKVKRFKNAKEIIMLLETAQSEEIRVEDVKPASIVQAKAISDDQSDRHIDSNDLISRNRALAALIAIALLMGLALLRL